MVKLSAASLVVAGAVAAFCLYRQFDDRLRRHVEGLVAQHYPGLKVVVGLAQLVEGKGIRLADVSIAEPGVEGPDAQILRIEQAMLECPTDWKELLSGTMAVRRVTIRRSTLRIARRADGSWIASKLLPPPKFGDRPPEVLVEKGVIEIVDGSKSPPSALELRDVNFTMTPTDGAQPGETPGSRRLRGTLSGDGFRQVEFEGLADLRAATCSVRGKAGAVEVSPELRDALPDPLARKLQPLGNLRGQMNVAFEVHYDPNASPPLRYDVSVQLARGRLDDPRLPHSLTDIAAKARIDNSGVAVSDLTARSGRGSVRVSKFQAGFEPNRPVELAAEASRLDLDGALLDLLPPWLQEQWKKYWPAGEVDADVRLRYDGRTWRPEVTLQCLDVSFTHHKFPYRVQHGTGTVQLNAERLKLNLTASAGSQPVRIAAEAEHPFHDPTGWFEAQGDNLALDETLIKALPEKPREVVRSFDPQGTVNFYIRMWRNQPHESLHEHLHVALNRCAIRYNRFPYPLSNVTGTLEMFDGTWTFRNLEASNGRARVVCKLGGLTPGFEGNELELNIEARDVPLDRTLCDALSPHIQQVWHSLRPLGTVDLNADIRYLTAKHQFSVGVRIEPQRDTASIEPVHFPYRLERLGGPIVYRDGHVSFDVCKAKHGQVEVSGSGSCDFAPDGRWQIQFDRLTAERLRADRELMQALPERLRKIVATLGPTTPVNLGGMLQLEGSGRAGEPPQSQWNMRVDFLQTALQCGAVALEDVSGNVTLAGAFDGAHVKARGELDVESLSYKDCQFRKVTGPIWIDDERVLFGSWVDRRDGAAPAASARAPRMMTAKLFGGNVYGDGWVTLEPLPRYAANATLVDADLAACAQEVGVGRQNLRGKVVATADINGSGCTRSALVGKGTVRLSDANVCELPVIIAVLKILSLRTPDQNAFSEARIDYTIRGEHIYFDQLNFHGDAISLNGQGEMDFQSRIRLTFHTMVGRGDLDLPVFKQLLSGASQQILQIHVGGTLQNPETSREVLPAVNQALQPLRSDSQNR